MQKNVASQKIIVFAFDATANTPKTGDAANLTAYVSKDYGAITVLGDTSATEMDSTNAKGYYLFDITQTETNADTLLVSAKSSTANIVVVGAPSTIFTTAPNFNLTSIDGSGRLDVVKVNGTSQTAGDIYSKVSGLTYTVASQVDVNVLDWKSATAPAMTGDAFARLGAPAGASISADIAAAKVDTAAIKVQTDKLTFTVANQIDANVLDWKSSTAPAMTGDAFARLGAPAGASVSADVAAVKVDTAAIKVQTDKLTFTVANKLDSNVYTWNGTAVSAPATAGIPEVNVKNMNNVSAAAITTIKAVQGLTTADTIVNLTNAPTAGDFTAVMKTSIGTAVAASAVASVTGNVGGNVVGSVGSVTGAVGSVTGNIGGNLLGTLTSTERDAIAAALLAATIETGATVLQSLRLANAANAGKVSGMATTTAKLRNLADTKDRVTATVDASGNRSAITLDLT